MKKLFFLFFLLQINKIGFSQYIQYNLPIRQFYQQPMVANPSLSGYQRQVNVVFRNQEIHEDKSGIVDGFRTFGIIGENTINKKFSAGIIAYQSKQIEGTTSLLDNKQSNLIGTFSFAKNLKDSINVSLGLNGGLWHLKDEKLGNSVNNTGDITYSQSFPILGIGISIRNKDSYFGVAIPQILNTPINIPVYWNIKYLKSTNFSAGLNRKLTVKTKINLAVMLVHTKGDKLQSYLNATLVFRDKFSFGYSKFRKSLIYGITYRDINSINISLCLFKRISINYLLDSIQFLGKPIITNQISIGGKIK